jgi:hypothetical protein
MFSRSFVLGLSAISILISACQKSDTGSSEVAPTPTPAVIEKQGEVVADQSDDGKEGMISRAVRAEPSSGKLKFKLWDYRLSLQDGSKRKIHSVECRARNAETGALEAVSDFSESLPVARKYLPSCSVKGLALYLKNSDANMVEVIREDELPEDIVAQKSAHYVQGMKDPVDMMIRSEVTSKHILIENRDSFDVTLKGQTEGCRMVKEIFIERTSARKYTVTEMQFCDVETTGRRVFSIEREVQFENLVDSPLK